MQSQHQFSQTPSVDIPRSSFNLSYPYKTTFDADYLVPIARPVDIMPGDTFSWDTKFFIRLATPLHPIMDNLYFETFAFFVPYRILWSNFEKFHGSQDDPGDSIDFTVPVQSAGAIGVGTLGDYFGLPTGISIDSRSALPYRAYNLIFNEWFRDENLQDSEVVDLDNGPDSPGDYALLKRGKRFDYYTGCLPWPQKGSAVSLPLGTSAPVAYGGSTTGGVAVNWQGTGGSGTDYAELLSTGSPNPIAVESLRTGVVGESLYADLTDATAATINDLRLSVQTQALLERDARSGTRYVEVIKAHWGVTSPDFRLQRPEFLGGGSSRINVTPVAQTSGQPSPAADDALGNLAGFGTGSGSHAWSQSFTEHGVVIILGNVRSDMTYFQGVDRYWNKSTRYDFFYPLLSQIGEQAVLNREIYYQNTSADDDVFGYQERYSEYRFQNGCVTGLMRPGVSGTLEAWHLAEEFGSLPTLGATFIENNTEVPLDRAIALSEEPQFIVDIFHQVRAARPMPLFGIPGSLARL